jgi:hypothetical protein
MKRAKVPEIPEDLSFERVQAYKSALRRYDRERIKSGEATPEEIQRENSLIPESEQPVILTFPELEKCR